MEPVLKQKEKELFVSFVMKHISLEAVVRFKNDDLPIKNIKETNILLVLIDIE